MFELWMFYIVLAIIAVLVEIFAPAFFCINFAFAGIITAAISVFFGDFYTTLSIFIALSVLSIMFVKPILIKYFKKNTGTDFNEQYIGKIVKVIEPVSCNNGAVTIYDERWEARVKDNEVIDTGCDVKITGHDSLILFVEKI